jgi:hypothetical protein
VNKENESVIEIKKQQIIALSRSNFIIHQCLGRHTVRRGTENTQPIINWEAALIDAVILLAADNEMLGQKLVQAFFNKTNTQMSVNFENVTEDIKELIINTLKRGFKRGLKDD